MILSQRTRRTLAALLGLCGVILLTLPPAMAQSYPERPVKIVSVTSAGTGVDDFTRLMAKYMSQKLGQNFYVENKPGANTILASDFVAKAAPDGYTLLLAAASSVAANPYLYKNLPYNPTRDFAPIARLSALPIAVVVPAKSPYRSLNDLLVAGRAKPGTLNYGTSSPGYRIMIGAINGTAKVNAVDVPYKAMSTLLPDLIAETLDYAMLEVSAAAPLIQSNKLRALAISSPTRVAALPDVPTLAEAGAAEVTLTSWVGLLAPAGVPQPTVDKLSQLAHEFLESPEAKAHFVQRGTTAYPAGPRDFARAIVDDQAKWKHYIAAVGIQPE